MLLSNLRYLLMALVSSLVTGIVFAGPGETLVIEHAPVGVGIRGQSIVLRAHVTNETRTIKQVVLFYAVSRDAAPYKTAMRESGTGWFTGTIPADLTAGPKQILYYIEARDASEATAETAWYTIDLKSPQSAATAPALVAPLVPAAAAEPPKDGKSSWKKPALIAGGVLLVGGAALALSGGGGGGGDDNDTPAGTTTNMAGTYSGTATTCFQPPGGSSSCSTRAVAITIDSAGNVTSDSLREGAHLEGRLSGANFLLVAPVAEDGLTGEIQYLGTVVNNRVAGSIQGTATTAGGTGTYSGNFSTTK
jgi:hypothetical protein